MPRNIEIKYRCPDLAAVRTAALSIGATPAAVLDQADTFFRAPTGRLKLREFGDGRTPAELIAYDRADAGATRASDYVIFRTDDAAPLIEALTRSIGTRGVVRKRRELVMWRNVRIHLDRVDGLGDFVELESVIDDEVDEATAKKNLDELIDRCGLSRLEVVPVAYADLLGLK
jgi:adenylate cyclase class IV